MKNPFLFHKRNPAIYCHIVITIKEFYVSDLLLLFVLLARRNKDIDTVGQGKLLLDSVGQGKMLLDTVGQGKMLLDTVGQGKMLLDTVGQECY